MYIANQTRIMVKQTLSVAEVLVGELRMWGWEQLAAEVVVGDFLQCGVQAQELPCSKDNLLELGDQFVDLLHACLIIFRKNAVVVCRPRRRL